MKALLVVIPLIVLSARGVAGAVRERNQVLSNCLRGRGYRVLN